MNILSKLYLVFFCGDELDAVIKAARAEKKIREATLKRSRLDLCEKHQPSNPGAHFAESNCDHCKVLEIAKCAPVFPSKIR